MEELTQYYFAYSSYSSVAHRYKLLEQSTDLFDLEKKISPILRASEIQKIKLSAKTLKHETEKREANIVTYYDLAYPKLLREIDKPPILLFCKGNMDLLQYDLVSVVGTRKPSSTSLLATNLLPEFLSKSRNLGIVSGVAMGIDRAVMLAALESNVPTIGVMGTGIEKEYPYQNRDLYQKIKTSPNGLLITEMRIGEVIGKWSFPRRNRIITGISRLLVMMEAPLKSGAMSSVAHALEQGREIMVFDDPSLLYNDGGRKLLEDGATRLTLTDLQSTSEAFFHISELIPTNFRDMPSLFSSLSQLENEGLFQNVGGGYYRKFATETQRHGGSL
ncbi:MAG: DNA-protecting protein DprA [Leptospiraceae bacterium]|nr:DNA-protecting protein DprA [Leptospiraceae bacterium]